MRKPKRYGLLGSPIGQSPSAAMMNAAFRAVGLEDQYELFEIPTLEKAQRFFQSLPSEGIAGLNITIPYKSAIYRWMVERADVLDSMVQLSCSVNTVVCEAERYRAFSTDGEGFIRSLKETGWDPKGKKVMILGAGGAAHAIAIRLKQAGAAEVFYYYLRMKRLHCLQELLEESGSVGRLEKEFFIDLKGLCQRILPECELLVNATPVGNFSFIEEHDLHERLFVCDILYSPSETALLREAKARGLKTLGGQGMLLHQGVCAFEIWTGKKAPVQVMREALGGVLALR